MVSSTHSKNKTSLGVAEESVESKPCYYILAVEFPDDDKIVYVKSDSFLFPDSLKKFDNEHDAHAYAKEQFDGLIYHVEKTR